MKIPSTRLFPRAAPGFAALLAVLTPAGSLTRAATVTYDADTGTIGAQDGAGAGWNTTNVNFWDGAADVLWPNTSADTAVFGAGSGAAGTVTVGGVTANGITFNAAGSGNYTLSGGTITLAGATPTLTANVNATISSVLAGAATLNKTGNGTLTLSGPNTYTGRTTLAAGVTSINTLGNVGGGASALGAPATAANGTIDFSANATLTYTGAATSSDRVINIPGAGVTATIFNSGSGLLTLTGGTTGSGGLFIRGAQNITLSGVLAHAGPLNRTDDGTLTLSNNANSYAGTTGISKGVLSVSGIANAGINSQIGSGSVIRLGQAGFSNTGTLRFTGASGGASNRDIDINNSVATHGGVIENTVSGQTLALSGNVSVSGGGTQARLTLTGAGNGQISGTISGTGLALVKSGAGAWTLSGDNTNTGTTTVSAGTLQVGNNGAAGSLGSGTISIASGAVLRFRRNDTALVVLNDISGAGALQIGIQGQTTKTGMVTLSGNNSFTGAVNINEGRLRITNASALGTGTKTITLNQGTNGNPGLWLDGSGGNITLPATLSFNASSGVGTGGIVSQAGDNVINGAFSLASGGGSTRFEAQAGASLTLNGTMTTTASGPRGPVLEGAGSGAVNGQITQNSAANFSAVVKNGTGTWTLGHANNAYTGATTVNAGTLALANGSTANNIASSTLVDVKAGATLEVTGLQGGALDVASGQTVRGAGTVAGGLILDLGAILSPGASPGTLTSGSQQWGGGGIYVWEVDRVDPLQVSQAALKGLNDGADWVNIQGGLSLTATPASPIALNLAGLQANDTAGAVQGWDPNLSYEWVIASTTSGISGFDADAFQIDTTNFANNNAVTGVFSVQTAGNDLLLRYDVVPEPGTASLVMLGGGLLLRRLRR